MNKLETGTIVWHDLLTHDIELAKRFYGDLLGWDYEVEHAEHFVWTGKAADYPLIVADEVAHGGFVEVDREEAAHWLAFVAAPDVDSATARVAGLGGRVVRQAFDIPGVGRTSVVADPGGALICPFLRSHDFPAPRDTFVWDELLTDNPEAAVSFYAGLFDWKSEPVDEPEDRTGGGGVLFRNIDGEPVAGMQAKAGSGADRWVTYLRTQDLNATIASAKRLGAAGGSEGASHGRLKDPAGVEFGLAVSSRWAA
ncbi:MAG: VOC family protein [Pseudomonadota bacterium]